MFKRIRIICVAAKGWAVQPVGGTHLQGLIYRHCTIAEPLKFNQLQSI